MKKYLLLQVRMGEDPTPPNSNVLAGFDHERHAIYAADLRMAKAIRDRLNTRFYWLAVSSQEFWAQVPEYQGMEQ